MQNKETKRKTFDFPKDDILEYLETKDNQTQYLRRLIRKEMENTPDISKEAVIEIVKDYLKNNNVTITNTESFDSDIINSISSIMEE